VARAVPLDHGGGDVHAAVYRVPSEGRHSVRLGDLPLDRRRTVLTASILFHIIHASFWLDFWSIWPDKNRSAGRVMRRVCVYGQARAAARKFAKYPLENKLYHGAIMRPACLRDRYRRVHDVSRANDLFPRNPYLFSDMTWG
jgi:hypothetical protein